MFVYKQKMRKMLLLSFFSGATLWNIIRLVKTEKIQLEHVQELLPIEKALSYPVNPIEVGAEKTPHKLAEREKEREKGAIMVLAAVPFDARHGIALWSELECFVGSAGRLVVSSAQWAAPIIDRIVLEARKNIPQFASGKVAIEARYFRNDRYDAGLWCDALRGLQSEGTFGYVLLLNDSVFALREYDGILEALRRTNRYLVSLNQHYSPKRGFWVESVFRGFDGFGVSRFLNHSCAPWIDGSFCEKPGERAKKRCIVDHHEIELGKTFPRSRVTGLFDGKVPEHMKSRKNSMYGWFNHDVYWRFLVNEHGFPAAKVKSFEMVANNSDPILGNCTRYLDQAFLGTIEFPRPG